MQNLSDNKNGKEHTQTAEQTDYRKCSAGHREEIEDRRKSNGGENYLAQVGNTKPKTKMLCVHIL